MGFHNQIDLRYFMRDLDGFFVFSITYYVIDIFVDLDNVSTSFVMERLIDFSIHFVKVKDVNHNLVQIFVYLFMSKWCYNSQYLSRRHVLNIFEYVYNCSVSLVVSVRYIFFTFGSVKVFTLYRNVTGFF